MIIGITGNIASGKDIICTTLKPYSDIIIDADKIGHFLLQQYYTILTKQFNIKSRKELSDLVFAESSSRAKLNRILHPPLIQMIKKIIENNKHKTIVINCALLFLFKLEFFCDFIIAPISDENIRINRLIMHRGLNKKKAEDMVYSQDNILLYQRHIHFLIDNITSKKAFVQHCSRIAASIFGY